MKAALKRLGLGVLGSAPIYPLLRRRALASDPVTILCYHTLRSDADGLESWLALKMRDFRAQVDFLRTHYEIVSLDVALEPTRSERPRVVLTFDDGEGAMAELLLPFVRAEKLPVTVYIATGQIESGRPYWFDRVMNALQGEGACQIDLPGLGCWQVGPARGNARWGQIGPILEALKAQPEETRDALADRIVAQGSPAPVGVTPFRPMTLAEMQELAASEFVTIGAHSHGHELLDRIAPEAAQDSIIRSRDLLAGWTGREIRHFAYPNGNYSAALMEDLRAAGFASATILEDRLAGADAPALALPRISVGRYDSLDRLKLRMVGI